MSVAVQEGDKEEDAVGGWVAEIDEILWGGALEVAEGPLHFFVGVPASA